jgi:hypothetical protein
MTIDATIYWIIAGSAFLGIILFAISTNIFTKAVEARGPEFEKKFYRLVNVIMFCLFIILGFSIVPIMVKLFTDALPSVITQSSLPVYLREHAMVIVYIFWGGFLIGLAIAVPASIKDGFFDDQNNSTK